MALYKGTITTAISGKIDGLVFSHNAGGKYIRNLAIPTNPNTIFQQVVRTAVAGLTATWQALTQAQRDAWELYADNVLITNRVGDQVNISGMAMYVRSNVTKLQIGAARQDTAPSIFNIGPRTQTPVLVATEASQNLDVQFATSLLGDPWANETGSFLVVYVARPQNASVNFFKGPYRFAATIQGDPTPPASPLTLAAPFAFIAGQRMFVRTVVSYEDGRYTADFRDDIVAIA